MLGQTKLSIYVICHMCDQRGRELDIPVTPITLAIEFIKQRTGQCALRPLCVVELEAELAPTLCLWFSHTVGSFPGCVRGVRASEKVSVAKN